MTILRSLAPVSVCTALLAFIVSHDIFKPIKVDLGFEHYAEKPDWMIGPLKFPEWTGMQMPLNTIVNVGYIVVGLYWLVRTWSAESKAVVGYLHAYFAYVFSWMSMLYGVIQWNRIVNQTHASAVLDQWATLPFFALLIVWCKSFVGGWNLNLGLVFMLSSILSYNLVFFSEFGFEIALVLHFINAMNAGLALHSQQKVDENTGTLILGAACFFLFVSLKLLDLILPLYSDIFTTVSGHFLSKLVGDIGQIHCTFIFLERVALKVQAEKLQSVASERIPGNYEKSKTRNKKRK